MQGMMSMVMKIVGIFICCVPYRSGIHKFEQCLLTSSMSPRCPPRLLLRYCEGYKIRMSVGGGGVDGLTGAIKVKVQNLPLILSE